MKSKKFRFLKKSKCYLEIVNVEYLFDQNKNSHLYAIYQPLAGMNDDTVNDVFSRCTNLSFFIIVS